MGQQMMDKKKYEEEVFEVLDTETYDKIIMVGDWNVYLEPDKDQKKIPKSRKI